MQGLVDVLLGFVQDRDYALGMMRADNRGLQHGVKQVIWDSDPELIRSDHT